MSEGQSRRRKQPMVKLIDVYFALSALCYHNLLFAMTVNLAYDLFVFAVHCLCEIYKSLAVYYNENESNSENSVGIQLTDG